VAHAGQELAGPNGFVLRLVKTGAETGGELVEMEARYSGQGSLPPEHLHPLQDERFDVLDGAVVAVVNGERRTYGAGESFDVPANTPHQMGGAEGGARVRWEVRPAMRTAEFFERLYGMMLDSGTEASAYDEFFREFSDHFRRTGPETR
jgi:quercetin dioxygenase-like cupin family protein